MLAFAVGSRREANAWQRYRFLAEYPKGTQMNADKFVPQQIRKGYN
ncbi:hypothetical protein [Anabaena azotica]|uniref:Uncharacterized protein n=1 Tax=Anabaena azotica FACHB-119 TaxID=947527 RepID=A0ABR8DAQ6_9NOST|nr:hypothetical protein [Anabaena azotica]MBD2502808.1 hypothetical protein [Anabaena azotica FACHB-119]